MHLDPIHQEIQHLMIVFNNQIPSMVLVKCMLNYLECTLIIDLDLIFVVFVFLVLFQLMLNLVVELQVGGKIDSFGKGITKIMPFISLSMQCVESHTLAS